MVVTTGGHETGHGKPWEGIEQGNDRKASEGMEREGLTLAAGEQSVRGDEQQGGRGLELA